MSNRNWGKRYILPKAILLPQAILLIQKLNSDKNMITGQELAL
jgi:hypothetical protein